MPETEKIEKSFLPWCKHHFPNVNLSEKDKSLCRNWLAGFTDGDGSFYTTVRKQKDYRIGFQFQAVFDLTQKSSSIEKGSNLLSNIAKTHFSEIKNVLINKVEKGSIDRIRIVSIDDLYNKVIPIFTGGLQTRKAIQFLLFKDAVEFIKNKEHLKPCNKSEIISFKERYKKYVL